VDTPGAHAKRPSSEGEEEIPSAVEVPDQPLGPGPEDLENESDDPADAMPGIPSDGEPPAAS